MEDHMDTEVDSSKSATTWAEMTVVQYLKFVLINMLYHHSCTKVTCLISTV